MSPGVKIPQIQARPTKRLVININLKGGRDGSFLAGIGGWGWVAGQCNPFVGNSHTRLGGSVGPPINWSSVTVQGLIVNNLLMNLIQTLPSAVFLMGKLRERAKTRRLRDEGWDMGGLNVERPLAPLWIGRD